MSTLRASATTSQEQVERANQANELLRHVWNHMHGQNMDGSHRPFVGDNADEICAQNWQRLSDAIGKHLDGLKILEGKE